MAPPAASQLPIKRNTALLSASLAANSGMMQMSAAVASLTFVLVTGVKGLLGLGPAIVLASGALAALPAGRAMDRFGRVPVLAVGFVIGALGGCLAAPRQRDRDRLPGLPRARPRRHRERDRAPRPGGRGGHVPARAARARHRARARRRGLRRHPRAGGLQPAPLRPRPRRRLARAPLARRLRLHARRPRPRPLRQAGPEADRRDHGGGDSCTPSRVRPPLWARSSAAAASSPRSSRRRRASASWSP